MYLKSLELQGFKSFPDKVKLTFDKGLTAVVGPNGSGKSNIGDSIRWVMGEQSTKTLRGNKMEDVIFSGTVARKPVGFAMVTLTLDNSDHVLEGDGDEVSVTRKLYRSGDSEYKINGKNVRLRDINELFMDTGLGRDGYSIIGQGRIAEIVGAKSSERRDIFEEAAGISKFRYKKQEAERKLSQAEENLLRLNDIAAELESRVGPLKHQSEKAEKYLVLAGERKKLEISVWVDRLGGLKEKLEELGDKLLLNKREYENIQHDIEREEEKINEGYRKIQSSSALVEELREKILTTEQSSSEYRSEIAVSKNEIAHCEESIASVREQRSTLTESKDKALRSIEEKTAEIERLTEKINELESSLSQIRESFDRAVTEADDLTESSEKANSEINGLYAKLSEYKAEIGNSDSSAKDIEEQLEALENQKGQLSELALQYDKEMAEITEGLGEFKQKAEEIENRAAGVRKLFEDKSRRLSDMKKENEACGFEIKGKEQRKKLLLDLERSMEGFTRSVKEVIKAQSNGRLSGIHGTLAQLIDVKQEYATAIETALGAAMQNIIVDDDNAAKRSIRMLKEQRLGRATFLPLTSIKGRTLDEPGLDGEDGFVAAASELVDFDEKYRSIVDFLLGRTAVAEDIDMAAVIAKRHRYKFRIVTLDGQVINAGGSFTGGSAVHSAGVFSRKNELEAIDSDILKLRQRSEQGMEKIKKLELECQQLHSQEEQLKGEADEVKADIMRFGAEYSRADALKKQTLSQASSFDSRYKALIEKRENTSKNARAAEENLEKTKALILEAESVLSKKQSRREEIRARREALSSELSEKKIALTGSQKDREALERERQSLMDGLDNSAQALKGLDDREKQLLAVIDEKNAVIDDRTQRLQNVKTDIEKYGAEIKVQQDIHNAQEMHVRELRSGIKNMNDAKEKYSGEISKIEERRSSSQKDFDDIVSRLYETYELTRSEAEEQAEKIEDRAGAQKSLNELKSKIKALGNVNVGAIDEYREVSERYKFLSEQLSDVKTSKKELEDLIEDLTTDMCRIFSESFAIINKNFSEIFVELFGGGKAELVLLDPENVLESGIEIRVAPPGKVIKNLISLSGGEQSFVAICIYFAILRLRPAPFCILDEIDAALDEVNVKKYAQYLKNFTDTTQFVLVTHRRSAMEEANTLYGVTMQEDGISKLLKMEQTDIENMAEDRKDKKGA